jgi:hypothetical protein
MTECYLRGEVNQIYKARIRDHLCEIVRGTVEEATRWMPKQIGFAVLPGHRQSISLHCWAAGF